MALEPRVKDQMMPEEKLPDVGSTRQSRRKEMRSIVPEPVLGFMNNYLASENDALPSEDAFRASGYNLVAAARGYVEISVDSIPEPERDTILHILRSSEGKWRYQQVFLRPDGSHDVMGASIDDFASDPPEAILDRENMREYGVSEANYWKSMKLAMTDARKKAAVRGGFLTLTALREIARDEVRAAAILNRDTDPLS